MKRPDDLVPAPTSSATTAWRLFRVGLAHVRQERMAGRSRPALIDHQQRALADLRRWARERSPFYRDTHRGLDSAPLEALPIVDKCTLMREFDRVCTDPRIRLSGARAHLAADPGTDLYLDRYVVLSTSGSTGQQGVFLFDPDEWIDALAAITRPLAWSKTAPRPWTRPRSTFVASTMPGHYSCRIAQDLATPLAPSLRCDAGWPLETLLRRLDDWQPQILATYPSVLASLCEAQAAGRLRIAPRHIGTSAEVLPDGLRQRVRQVFGVDVRDTYGATELAPIATECEAGFLHLLEDRAIVEIADAEGRSLPPGETGSQLLLTVLHRRTQPLIRYSLGDRVRELPGICPCGRALRRLAVVEGRIEESLLLPSSGTGPAVVVHPNLLHGALEGLAHGGWQVRQSVDREHPHLRVLLLRTPESAADASAAVHRTLDTLFRRLGIRPPTLDVQWVQSLPRGATGKAPLIARERE
jgi:phenylacetate-coenzyme A ligase PaaK-like adenylate-forming protein